MMNEDKAAYLPVERGLSSVSLSGPVKEGQRAEGRIPTHKTRTETKAGAALPGRQFGGATDRRSVGRHVSEHGPRDRPRARGAHIPARQNYAAPDCHRTGSSARRTTAHEVC